MTKQMNSFKFYFKNGETWTIEKNNIGDLWIKQITTSFGRINGGELEKIHPCASFKIEIFEEADHVLTEDINLGGLEMGMFERAIKYEDIEKMDVSFGDDEMDTIYFPYLDKGTPGQEGLDNKYQTTKVGKNGHLYIVIDSDQSVEDIYGESF